MQYRLLGQLEVISEDGAPVTFGGEKERVLLAVLLLARNHPVSSARLIEALWGEDPPTRATNALQVQVSRMGTKLSRAGDGPFLAREGSGYRLRVVPGELDVDRFEQLMACADGDLQAVSDRLSQALSLWRGPALAGVESDALAGEAVRLEELRSLAVDRWIDAELKLGRHSEVIPQLEALVAEQPLREGPRRQLMLALYRSGRQADALSVYSATRRVLADQLGIDPSPDLQALELAILNQDPRLDAPGIPPATRNSEARVLPSGNVTFLFTDVEDSTRLFEQAAETYPVALEEHRAILRSSVATNGGVEVRTEGDRFFIAFANAQSAVEACLEAQQAVARHPWPEQCEIRVRMGLHTGVARPSPEGDYVALAAHQAARICAAAHGGQVLMSADTARLTRQSLVSEGSLADRGLFSLRGSSEPERIFQLVHPTLRSSFPPLRASPAQVHNLPDMRTLLVGRASDIKALDELLGMGRLVTVVGPGGSGKTRLAVEVASRMAAGYDAGASLCDLSSLDEETLVPAAMAQAFNIQDIPGVDPLDAVARALAERPALLVLDNCEHLLVAVAASVDRLLATATRLSVLATSREPLGVPGEQLWRIGPLPVPGSTGDLTSAEGNEAVKLFVSRARLVKSEFALSQANVADVAAICVQLDGIPLAIELAAGHCAGLSPAAIAELLADPNESFALNAGRSGARHSTMEVTVDWSYRLLTPSEQQLLRYLSVFAGGFTLGAARATTDTEHCAAVLSALVSKSLVIWDTDSDRYRMLETIRAFARKRLEHNDEADSASSRHLTWCVDFANSLGDYWTGAGDVEAFDAIERELDNFRTALAWATDNSAPDGVRLAERLGAYWCWSRRCNTSEARRWLDQTTTIPGAQPRALGNALSWAAIAAYRLGEQQAAWDKIDQALAVLADVGDVPALLGARFHQALILQGFGRVDDEKVALKQLCAEAVKRGDAYIQGRALNALTSVEEDFGNPSAAIPYGEQALRIGSENLPVIVTHATRINLAEAILDAGQPAGRAIELLVEALRLNVGLRSVSFLINDINALAKALAPTDPQNAAILIATTRRFESRHAVRWDPTTTDINNPERLYARLRDQLGDRGLSRALDEAPDMTLDEATDFALTVADRWNARDQRRPRSAQPSR
jgi:predicted ATPase/DNA-binding SARP family transcriptional activator